MGKDLQEPDAANTIQSTPTLAHIPAQDTGARRQPSPQTPAHEHPEPPWLWDSVPVLRLGFQLSTHCKSYPFADEIILFFLIVGI